MPLPKPASSTWPLHERLHEYREWAAELADLGLLAARGMRPLLTPLKSCIFPSAAARNSSSPKVGIDVCLYRVPDSIDLLIKFLELVDRSAFAEVLESQEKSTLPRIRPEKSGRIIIISG